MDVLGAADQFYLRVLTTLASMSATLAGLSLVFAGLLHEQVVRIKGETPQPEENARRTPELERLTAARYGFVRSISGWSFIVFVVVALWTIGALVYWEWPIERSVVLLSAAGLAVGVGIWLVGTLIFVTVNILIVPNLYRLVKAIAQLVTAEMEGAAGGQPEE